MTSIDRWRTSAKRDARVRRRGIAIAIVVCGAAWLLPDLAHDFVPGPPPRSAYSQVDLSRGGSLSLDAAPLPFDALPRDAIAARLTINPPVNQWATTALEQAFETIDRSTLGGLFNSRRHPARVNAVLADGRGRIRAMYSNAEWMYFGPETLALASTAKIFLALALGRHDDPAARYCNPAAVTTWLAVDALLATRCGPGGRSVSARNAFARSMPSPLLWRSFQVVTEAELRDIFEQLGFAKLQHRSLRTAAAMGHIEARPLDLHRAVHAVTLAFAGRSEPAETPTVIDTITVRKPDGTTEETSVARAFISSAAYRRVVSPEVAAYARDVLSATIRYGTLQELAGVRSDHDGISLLWGKTGTYAVGSDTLHIWIVGGLVVDGEPYSWLVLVRAADPEHSFGNINASAFAPLAKILIAAAVRDRRTALVPPGGAR
jgi:membrane peptidoglycan carboxypeptidase